MLILRITGRWLEERSSTVSVVCSNGMLVRKMSRLEGG